MALHASTIAVLLEFEMNRWNNSFAVGFAFIFNAISCHHFPADGSICVLIKLLINRLFVSLFGYLSNCNQVIGIRLEPKSCRILPLNYVEKYDLT